VVENPAATTWFTGKPSADMARRATIVRRDVYVNYEWRCGQPARQVGCAAVACSAARAERA
jgi:hypothetical protein